MRRPPRDAGSACRSSLGQRPAAASIIAAATCGPGDSTTRPLVAVERSPRHGRRQTAAEADHHRHAARPRQHGDMAERAAALEDDAAAPAPVDRQEPARASDRRRSGSRRPAASTSASPARRRSTRSRRSARSAARAAEIVVARHRHSRRSARRAPRVQAVRRRCAASISCERRLAEARRPPACAIWNSRIAAARRRSAAASRLASSVRRRAMRLRQAAPRSLPHRSRSAAHRPRRARDGASGPARKPRRGWRARAVQAGCGIGMILVEIALDQADQRGHRRRGIRRPRPENAAWCPCGAFSRHHLDDALGVDPRAVRRARELDRGAGRSWRAW